MRSCRNLRIYGVVSVFVPHNLYYPGTNGSVLYPEIIKEGFILVLRCKACVEERAGRLRPLAQTTIIEHFELVGDDKRHDAAAQAFLEHYQSTDATIAVLKRMYRLEALMEIKDVFHGYRFL